MARMATKGWKGLLEEWERHGAGQLVLRSRYVRPLIARAAEIVYWHSYAWTGTTWMGVPAMKYPADAWSYQEIMFETKPDLIIETGTNRGGSALFLAHMFDLIGKGRVVTVDIETRPDRPIPARRPTFSSAWPRRRLARRP